MLRQLKYAAFLVFLAGLAVKATMGQPAEGPTQPQAAMGQQEEAPAAPQPAPGQQAAPAAPPTQQAPTRVTEGLVALYRPSQAQGATLPDLAKVLEPLNLTIQPGPIRATISEGVLVFAPPTADVVPGAFSDKPATSLIQALKQAGQLTVEAWVSSANIEQRGPARIVTISRNPHLRNVTLAQDLSQFVLRLRTTATDDNGMPELRSPEGTVQVDRWQHVVAVFDGLNAALWVDGTLVAIADDRAGTLQNWDETMHLGLGNEISGQRDWAGKLALVAIYRRALTPDQIRTNFLAGTRE